MKQYDFSGWATRNDLKCSDGRVIRSGAFKHHDGETVPLVWNHQHNDSYNVLGHALLENRKEGIYAYGTFNDTETGQNAKRLVNHGDITSLSICANQIRERGGEVTHGRINEISLVLAGANPGAFIDTVIQHSEDEDGEAIIYTGETIELFHQNQNGEEDTEIKHKEKEDDMAEKTVQDIFDSLSEEQKNVVYFLIGKLIEDLKRDDENGEENGDKKMKHNIFDNNTYTSSEILSDEEVQDIFREAKRFGSLRESVIQHNAQDMTLMHGVQDDSGKTVTYGVANLNYLFPDARAVSETPDFISRDMSWVDKVMNGSKHLPFSRVKSLHANITMEEARAKGYIKGNEKTNEVFALLKRSTAPTTIYKKQKLDRDDIVDITDFNIVAWLKKEMRIMLNEEIARAALIGDGRQVGTDDKISEDCIRPIYTDNDLYTIRKEVAHEPTATDSEKAKAFIKAAIKARKDYRGTGTPTLFTTEDMLTDCLLIEDTTGRIIYETADKLKTALRVSDIVTVPVMENQKRSHGGKTYPLMGIIVNMSDYAFGADKGGAVNMFDDFDIDFNQEKYLIETRCSGALIKPYSAIVIEGPGVSG